MRSSNTPKPHNERASITFCTAGTMRWAGLGRGLAGLDSSAQERRNPDFGRECPMYRTLVGDIQQAGPLLF